jgi:hypothetical protein
VVWSNGRLSRGTMVGPTYNYFQLWWVLLTDMDQWDSATLHCPSDVAE